MRGRASRFALIGLGVAALLAVATGVEAWRLDPLPEPASPAPGDALPARTAIEMPSIPESIVFAAVARDPFRPDRERPPTRYRLPGQGSNATSGAVRRPTPRLPQLTGTVVSEDGKGMAIFQSRGQSRTARVGEKVDEWTVTRLNRGSVTLAGHDTTVVLRLPGAASDAAAESEEP